MSGASLFALPFLASAQGTAPAFNPNNSPVENSITNILLFINDIIIPSIIAIGFLVFVWGMFKYFIAGGADEGKRDEGKSLMIWATLGFVLIIVFWGVVNLFANSTGLDAQTLENRPNIVIPGGN